MAKQNSIVDRTLSLNQAGRKLGLDKSTRYAMTHIESFNAKLVERDMTWEDAPGRFGVEDLFSSGAVGRLALKFCRIQEGFRVFEAAVNDPSLRPPLLEAYAMVLEISPLEEA